MKSHSGRILLSTIFGFVTWTSICKYRHLCAYSCIINYYISKILYVFIITGRVSPQFLNASYFRTPSYLSNILANFCYISNYIRTCGICTVGVCIPNLKPVRTSVPTLRHVRASVGITASKSGVRKSRLTDEATDRLADNPVLSENNSDKQAVKYLLPSSTSSCILKPYKSSL